MDEKHLGYLDLTKDISFKRYFSSNKQVLFSLIKSFLPTPDNAPDMMTFNPGIFNLVSKTANQQNQSGGKLHLQDSSIPPDTPGGKQVVLDLHVKLHSGENIDIEMQGYSQKDLFSRMLAYWVQLHSYGMRRGQKFDQIDPSYLLVFTRFTVFDEEDYINETTITLRKHRHKELTKDFGLVIVELNKFNKNHLELVDMTDRWCYIIKHSAELTAEQVKHLSQDGETKMALKHLEKVSKENREYWNAILLERQEWERHVRKQEIMEEVKAEGLAEGKVKRDHEIALNMLQENYEVSEISKLTGLSVDEIKQLKNGTTE